MNWFLRRHKGALVALSLSVVVSACLFSRGDDPEPENQNLSPAKTTDLFNQSMDVEPLRFEREAVANDAVTNIPGVYNPEVAKKIMAEIAKQGVIHE